MSSRNVPSWIEAYLAYTAESESPEDYHIWVAISTIAGALRRQVYFDMGYFLLYPNLYVVLVGPPGRCKKSTAMRTGRALGGQVPGMEFSVDSTTRERLVLDMATSFKDGQSAITVHSSEFASLVTSSGMDMVAFLTDVFDSPLEWTHKTKSGGTNKIKAPFCNMLAAATPEWIAKGLPLDTIGIGFTSRIVFIYADTPRKKPPFPRLTEAQKRLSELLTEDLARIASLNGEFTFNDEAYAMYEAWYEARFDNPNPTHDPRLDGYFERKPMHLIKLCMIVSASKRDDLIITEDDLVQSLKMFDRAEQHMPKVFAAVGRNPLYAEQEAALELLVHSGEGFTKGQLLERLGHNIRVEELEEILQALQIVGKVQILPGGTYKFIG
jgi:hypothetical protein